VHDVFISYSKHDRSRVERLVGALEAEGWTVYWDRRLLAGDAWHTLIATELQVARCVIVAWSPRAAASNWVRDEATQGLQRGVLIPVVIDPVAIPLGFGQVHTIAVMDAAGDLIASAVPDLLASVRRHLRASGAAAAARFARPAVPPDPSAGSTRGESHTTPDAVAVEGPLALERGPARRGRWTPAVFLVVYPLLVMVSVAVASLSYADTMMALLVTVVGAVVSGVAARRLVRRPAARAAGAETKPDGFASLVLPVATPIVITLLLLYGPVIVRTVFAVMGAVAGAVLAALAARRGAGSAPASARVGSHAAGAGLTWFAAAFTFSTALSAGVSTWLSHALSSSDYLSLLGGFAFFIDRSASGGEAFMWLWGTAIVMAAGVAPALRRGLEHDG
jgi:hypothetical protein